MKVAAVERKLFGGTCVNVGCTPTKTLVASAYAAHIARRGGEYGVAIDGPVTVDMKRVKARKDAVVAPRQAGLEAFWISRGSISMTVTSLPKRRYICANSRPMEDEDISAAILRWAVRAVEAGADFAVLLCDRNAPCVEPHADTFLVQDVKVSGSHLLLAAGRRPNTDDLGLEQAGVLMDQRGYIVVDDQLPTNVPGIWALGDCNGRGAFTHTAFNDFEIVAANLLDNDPRRADDRPRWHAPSTRARHRAS
jgi:pyruvate/2-oxoglutarate dehydrogenase complex dihydrolipoamide dehydrogenase (E3) component